MIAWIAWVCLETNEGDGKYKHTVDLPKTTFGMRANSLVREPEIQKIWDEHQVFNRVVERNTGVCFIVFLGYLSFFLSRLQELIC